LETLAVFLQSTCFRWWRMEFDDAVKRVEIVVFVDQLCVEPQCRRGHEGVRKGNFVGGLQLCRLAAQNVIGVVPAHKPAFHLGQGRLRVCRAPLLEEWGKLLGDVPTAGAILDRFLHHAQTIAITGWSYRLKDHAAIAGKEDKTKKTKSKPNEPLAAEPASCMARFPVLLVLLCCWPIMKRLDCGRCPKELDFMFQ
jgi:hypothetical protein